MLLGLLNPAMVTDSSVRHEWLERIMGSRIGRVLNMVPFILLMALASSNLLAALWSAFGTQMFLLALEWYRSRYNVRVAFPMVLTLTELFGFVLLIILVYSVTGFPWRLVTPILISLLFATVTISLILCKPFSMQYVSKITDEATWRSPEFLKTHMMITGIWEACFGLMALSVWIAYGVFSDSQSAGYIALGIVIPIVLPVFTTVCVSYLRSVADSDAEIRAGAASGHGNKKGEEFDGHLAAEKNTLSQS